MAGSLSPVTLAISASMLGSASFFILLDASGVLGTERSGVLGRALCAFGLALFVVALAIKLFPRSAILISENRSYEDLVATIPFGVACWDRAGALLTCNDQYRHRLGGSTDVMPGSSYHRAVNQLVRGGYMRVVSEDENNRVLELHREDGSFLLIDERPLRHGGFITLVTDITERRRGEQLLTAIREEQRQLARRYHEEKLKAEAASRSKTSFLAHLSHDIRTPLNHIIGFAELMRHQTYGPLGDPRYLSYVDTIKGSGERLLSFFASILELAELESGQKALKEERFGIDDVLFAASRRFSMQARRAGLVLVVGAASGATVKADRYSLDRMVCNIVDNAIRFTPAGGKVTLGAYAAPDGVVIEVTDTGIGMSEEQLETLSQPFAFGDAAFAREHKGAGLGIAIARAIAELSGGHLAIDSRPALGTTVAVSLPIAAMERAQAAE
ncbi:PAS domain-containing sensor histidine kinase [Arsenicitalea aurantiaca]|uniref:sensor histidine kinase n=1 Tax=Arsenicitalea aurantiaca TaxID=1783274 RepID=UPI00131515A5|nr:PAS domain-containing sensor histidine kinase [Arsenicitalea aurantiaca]